MSDLIAIAYPDVATADEVRDTLLDLQRTHSVEMEDLVVITRDENGRVKLHQSTSPVAVGALGGALWGTLIGLLFFVPLLGTVFGAAAGAAGGALTDLGMNDSFVRDLGDKLGNRGAAVIVLVRKVTPDKVLPEIERFGGDVLQTSLSDESEARLQEVLTNGQSPAAEAA